MSVLKGEDLLSSQVKHYLDELNKLGVINTIHFHVPNEFKAYKNHQAAWAKKKAIGCVAGAPDWVIVSKDKTLLLELKNAKTQRSALGKMKDSQRNFAKECGNKEINYALAWGKNSLLNALKKADMIK